jgi:hypothetical protein
MQRALIAVIEQTAAKGCRPTAHRRTHGRSASHADIAVPEQTPRPVDRLPLSSCDSVAEGAGKFYTLGLAVHEVWESAFDATMRDPIPSVTLAPRA